MVAAQALLTILQLTRPRRPDYIDDYDYNNFTNYNDTILEYVDYENNRVDLGAPATPKLDYNPANETEYENNYVNLDAPVPSIPANDTKDENYVNSGWSVPSIPIHYPANDTKGWSVPSIPIQYPANDTKDENNYLDLGAPHAPILDYNRANDTKGTDENNFYDYENYDDLNYNITDWDDYFNSEIKICQERTEDDIVIKEAPCEDFPEDVRDKLLWYIGTRASLNQYEALGAVSPTLTAITAGISVSLAAQRRFSRGLPVPPSFLNNEDKNVGAVSNANPSSQASSTAGVSSVPQSAYAKCGPDSCITRGGQCCPKYPACPDRC